jgi:hypothetical protein
MIEEKPKKDRIRKTTSKIALIGLAAATMMITLSIVGAIQLQQASAAPGSPQTANGDPDPNYKANNRSTDHAYSETPANQPCALAC